MSVTLDVDDEPIPGLLPDGRPDPAYAAALGLVPASAGRRSLAFAIDAFIVVLLSLPVTLGTLPLWLGLALTDADLFRLAAEPAFVAGLIFFLVGEGLVTVFMVVQLILPSTVSVTWARRSGE